MNAEADLTQVEFTHEELTVLTRLLKVSLPQFQPLALDDVKRSKAIRELYARGVITPDRQGQFSVKEGVTMLLRAGSDASSIIQLDCPLQDFRDILYQLDGLSLRQSKPRAGVQRFQALDTPNKLATMFKTCLNNIAEPSKVSQDDPMTLSRTRWQALRSGSWSEDLPLSLYEALKVPSVVVSMTHLPTQAKAAQPPKDLFIAGHPEGGYWVATLSQTSVFIQPATQSETVQVMVDLIHNTQIRAGLFDMN